MRVLLTVTAGPHKGLEFAFDRHDTFLVGRSEHAHFQLPAKDRYFSRIHFMMEVNPPECRLIDMGSHNGTYVNGAQVLTADLKDGDQIRAGHTILRLRVQSDAPAAPSESSASIEREDAGLPRIPGYVLERELGRGAMGVTYLATRADDPTLFAVKVVRPSCPGSPAQIEDFLRSARALTLIHHPHLVQLREVGECPSGFFFVSDYLLGSNAADIVQREGPLSVPRVLLWAEKILRALTWSHARHLFHCDIKPANVLVADIDGYELVKLSDYAISRAYQAAPFSGLSLTAALVDLGSFLPPELLYNYQEVNALCDQYAVAALLYYLLAGAPMLASASEDRKRFSSLARHQHVPLRKRRPDVPAVLAEAIHKALSRDPSLRFPDVAAFGDALLHAAPRQ